MTSRVWVYVLAIVVLGLGAAMTLRLTVKGLDTPTVATGDCSEFKETYLTEADAGTEFRLVVTSRFGFCLDEATYPLSDLQTVGCPFGQVSNWSQRGPGRYPIGFEITGTGACEVRNGDFWVRIVGITYAEANG